MRRAILGLYTYAEFFASAVIFLAPMGLATLRTGDAPGRRIRGRWMRRFGKFASSLTPIWSFRAEGTPPADIDEKAYVVISNHESTADPFLLCELPFDTRFIAKEEIFKLPLLGWLMRFSGDIPLRRGDKESVVRMLDEVQATLAAGVSVMVFPEGTRSPDGNMLPFKDGAFQMAIDAQVPLLPLALAGTRECRPKGSLWFGNAEARVRILEPIPTAGMTHADIPKLKELARQRIQEGLVIVRSELGLAQRSETPKLEAPAVGNSDAEVPVGVAP